MLLASDPDAVIPFRAFADCSAFYVVAVNVRVDVDVEVVAVAMVDVVVVAVRGCKDEADIAFCDVVVTVA